MGIMYQNGVLDNMSLTRRLVCSVIKNLINHQEKKNVHVENVISLTLFADNMSLIRRIVKSGKQINNRNK